MTIKEATQTMLRTIRAKSNEAVQWKQRITDKEIAQTMGITKTSFSRLSTGVTSPNINTWAKICKAYAEYAGNEALNQIVQKLE